MPDPIPPRPSTGFLGIEAGGTRTSATWLDVSGQVSSQAQFGPANLKLLGDRALRTHLHHIANGFPRPLAVGIGMAGTRTSHDRSRLRNVATAVWPGIPITVTHDLDSALAAADLPKDQPSILLVSGTGSCAYGRSPDGKTVRVGGWGHLLGDQGSGYDIALRALRNVVSEFDRSDKVSTLGRAILEHLRLNEPDQLIGWIHGATKDAIAAIAPAVFRAAHAGNASARSTIQGAAAELASTGIACARRLASPQKAVLFVLTGGILLHQPTFARCVKRALLRARPGATICHLNGSGSLGAARLAKQAFGSPPTATIPATPPPPSPDAVRIPSASDLSPTEQRNPESMLLDRLSPSAAVDLMLREEGRVSAAVLQEKPRLVRALRLIHRAMRSGGRLFYVGAGTSGRLGILDASECPPTFRSPPEWVQGIIAGGSEAVFRAVEGAEDDPDAGQRAITCRGVTSRDVVVGIAASGRTPFVWGALYEARRRGAATILVCFNPHLAFARGQRPDVVITPSIGPEVLTGSTRLKAGTATKLILNLFTTLTMVRLGKVISNLMVDLNPANTKLRERAIRITTALTGVPAETAQAQLEREEWIVKKAVQALRRTYPADRRRRAPSSS